MFVVNKNCPAAAVKPGAFFRRSWILFHNGWNVDCILKVIVPDKAAFDAFYKGLIRIAAHTKETSYFIKETIKEMTALQI